jgi:uncharacterized surface protein with fasciclin (FAS1) repeats
MISIQNKLKISAILIISVLVTLTACNKEPEQFTESPQTTPAGLTLGETLAARPEDSLFYKLVVRSGLLPSINNKTTSYTMFAADNNAMKVFVNAASGGAIDLTAPDAVFAGFISTVLPVESAAGIVSYNITPQALTSANIPDSFPNFQYPSILNPAPSISPFLRLTTFPSSRNGFWVNNIPVKTPDINAANGVIHETPALVIPPTEFLWDRINTDPGLTYLKAAIERADSGIAATSSESLIGGLNNIGANLTVFAPNNAAMQTALTFAIYQGLVKMGVPDATAIMQATTLASTPDVFSNPALFGVLTAQLVKGLVIYHILPNRAFTNNFPTTATAYPTLLNSAVPVHPGVTLQGTAGVPIFTAATVKGAINTNPSNIIINPFPGGSSDQHYLNGVLHKIDEVLIPVPL